jgi:hypothetical protein
MAGSGSFATWLEFLISGDFKVRLTQSVSIHTPIVAEHFQYMIYTLHMIVFLVKFPGILFFFFLLRSESLKLII